MFRAIFGLPVGLLLLIATAGMFHAGPVAAATYWLSGSQAEVLEGNRLRIKVYRNDGSKAEDLVWRNVNESTSRSDFNFSSERTIRFSTGETMKRIIMRPFEDTLVEGPETFRLELVRVKSGGSFRNPRTITVTVLDANSGGDVNGPPVISGQPNGEAEAGSPWAFSPNASDADGDALTFVIQNRPGWASFDATTGRLSGTPGDSHVGPYPDIRIGVTDGQAQTNLQAFAIDVRSRPQSTGSAALHWTPPTSRIDGTSLSNLAGYRIYRGTTTGNLNMVREVGNPGVTSFLMEGLTAGEWHFAISAIDGQGRESTLSNIVSRWVN